MPVTYCFFDVENGYTCDTGFPMGCFGNSSPECKDILLDVSVRRALALSVELPIVRPYKTGQCRVVIFRRKIYEFKHIFELFNRICSF